ncbi:sucrase ferredoxin [Rhodococcus sp. MTM3W5.2]|uniref:sucrase ferredoxin n=1 Tax=Rhodococcus sp. MTM3W5.2 TaxID=1805827 RepID=UPI001CB95602|nr:sucrase ferredoxin [Rhodococcus sp. MTM3W5.2]
MNQSSLAGEAMVGRAGPTDCWILIEHPGPWPASAPDGELPPSLSQTLDSVVGRLRVLFIRRPRSRQVADPLCVISWSDGTKHWMREKRIQNYHELDGLDFDSIAAGIEPDFGVARTEALVAVCTHGKKDACCAELGRPVLAALTSTADDVWECTHVGGDRFAANLVMFPHGLYFSRLGADSARQTVDDYRNGAIALPHFRGRSALSQPAQAAEHAVRDFTGITRTDALREVVECEVPNSGDRLVQIRLDSRRFGVVVRSEPQHEEFRHGCGAGGPVAWNRWVIVGLDEVPD